MLKQTLKRMVLTVATVMVLVSTAAPAMAAQTSYYDDDPKTLQFCIIVWCPS